MSRVVVSMFVSLDGVIEEPIWTFPYWSEAIAQQKYAELFSSDALLLGRKTYEGLAQAWSPRQGSDEYADRINALPKYVVTTTLEQPTWNATFLKGDIARAIRKLRQQPGGDLLLFGSGKLVQFLVHHNLVDRYHLTVYPLILGKGQRLFEGGANTKLKLVESTPFPSGAVALVYEPAQAA